MEALSRQEYPAMLERLPPAAAVSKLNERVKKIGKVNTEIADWLQERRKVEEAYVAGLKKLARRPLQEVGGDLGIFESPWRKIVGSTEEIAKSHSLLSDRIDKDVEQPLRNFASNNREMAAMTTIQGNLASMAKDLEDAQDKSEKLSRKGGKASAQKVDAAASRLSSATQLWDSQAPFIFETLQALDERRLNQLRDVLTQYQTHEADQFERNRKTVEETLSSLLEIETAQEIKNWAQSSVAGKPLNERRATTRQSSIAGSVGAGASNLPPPQTPASTHTDNQSEHSGKQENTGSEFKLKSRLGTMIGRRRQSIHGTFGRASSPSKGFVPFGRNTASRDGRPSPSPRASSGNLRDSPAPDNRLASLAESPPARSPTSQTNGFGNRTNAESAFISDAVPARSSSHAPNGFTSSNLPDLSDVQPPPGPPPSHLKAAAEAQKDAEGFTVPAAMNDPISQAQQDAAFEGEQPQFKLDIRKEPIPEQDADAQAALSNVANTLRSAQTVTPNRKAGTVRGRRDVRNTVFLPSHSNSLDVTSPDTNIPPSPGIATGRAAALAALSSGDHTAPSASDTTSIRSGHSLTNHALIKHVETHDPGLNASVIETVSVTFENGEVKTSKINGEIALIYNRTDDDASLTHETIRINNFPNLEVIGPNRTFISPVSTEKPDEFAIDLSPISSKSSVAFTYRVHIDEANLTTQGPLLIKNSWKVQGDKLGLVVEYSRNPAFSSEPVTFNNLVLVGIYTGARATGCQTKPTGTHLKEKSLVYWRLGDVTLSNDWHKVICRFSGSESAVPEPGHIEARWEINNPADSLVGSGISISKFEQSKGKGREENDDPFADETIASVASGEPLGKWVEIGAHKKLVSGKYEAR